MTKVLPLVAPAIKSYSNHAHIFSILGAQKENYYPWLYNHYVQLYAPDDSRSFLVDYMIDGMYTDTPNLFTCRIERRVALSIKDGIINFLRFMIDNGYYIYTDLNVSKIEAYKDENMEIHDPLLYGYDDELEEIYFIDTYKRGKYSTGVATYTEILEAIGNEANWDKMRVSDLDLDLLCMKCKNHNTMFRFNVETYVKLLEDYINKKDSYKSFWQIPGVIKGPEEHYICGIAIYDLMRKHLEYVRENDSNLDKRGFFVILEHKKILEQTMLYLLGENWKEQYVEESRLLQNEIDKATIALRLCLKYTITKEKDILEKLGKYAIELVENEKRLFPKIIEILKDKEEKVQFIDEDIKM